MSWNRILASSVVLILVMGSMVYVAPSADAEDLGIECRLADAHASFLGEASSDYSGWSVAGAGDVNGDGYDDFLMGAYGNNDGDSDAGKVYLILGKPSGWDMDFRLSNADASFVGEDAFNRAGYSVAGAGDVNGDGFDDILIGAYRTNNGGRTSNGQAYVIFGKASGWKRDIELTQSDASFWGESTGDYAGSSVAGAGDVNGDGYDDFLVGAPGDDDNGAYSGQTYLILGKKTGWYMNLTLGAASASFIGGEIPRDSSGSKVSGVGDVNRDGYDDFLISAYADLSPASNNRGETYLIFGKATGWTMDAYLTSAAGASYIGETPNDYSGCSIAAAGDVNNDGYDDFLIGAYGYAALGRPESGHAYLILGKEIGWNMDSSLNSVSASFWGEYGGDRLGWSVSGGGDVNSDGYDDFLIGAYRNDEGGSNSGISYLILGKETGWAMDTWMWDACSAFMRGEAADDYSGCSVAGAGDVNGDGFDDILVGAYGNDEEDSGAGQTYLILPNARPPSIEDLEARLIEGISVHLSWDKPSWNEVITGYRIYRSVDGSDYQHIDTTTYTYFIDSTVKEGETYFYSIVVVYDDGKMSDLGERTSITCVHPFPSDLQRLHMDFDLAGSHASFLGENRYDRSGYSVAGAGDVNGDGYDDFLVGAPYNDEGGTYAGQTYLFLGNASGWSADASLSSAGASFYGEADGDRSGYSIAGAGDVNGDGYDDIIIGAYANKEMGYQAGQAYIIFGKVSGWSMDTNLSKADASFLGEDEADYAGYVVAGAGDVNADGYDDVLISAPEDEEGPGQVYLILGKASGWSMDTVLSSADASFLGESHYAGSSVGGAGDVNGDGFDDILIGAPNNGENYLYSGQTYLVFGKASGWSMDTAVADSDASFLGEYYFDYSGSSVSSAGDVNGDGFDDFLIGAHGFDDGGKSYLKLGHHSGWSMDTYLSTIEVAFVGGLTGRQSGRSVASAGDVNQDGFGDFLIGDSLNSEADGSAGQVYLILGKETGWDGIFDLTLTSASFLGEEYCDYVGRSMACAGDVNGDGYDDILIGSDTNDEGGASAGQTYLEFPNIRPYAPHNLQATLSPDRPVINLTWQDPGPWIDNITGYRVYASSDGSNFHQVVFKLPSHRTYSDTSVVMGRTYHYAVVTEDATGALSDMSAMVSLVCDLDTDADGVGNLADDDDDGDGVIDVLDAFPLDPAETRDTDGDGTGDNADIDDDGDGVADGADAFPKNPMEYADGDGDGIGDLMDPDDDNDGVLDIEEATDVLMTMMEAVNSTMKTMKASMDSMSSTIGQVGTDMSYVRSYLQTMDSQLRSELTTLETSLQASLDVLGSDLAGDLQGLNATLAADIQAVVTSITTDLDEMNGSFSNELQQVLSTITGTIVQMNLSLSEGLGNSAEVITSDIDALSAWLDLVMSGLEDEVRATNETIMGRLDEMDALVEDFYSDMEDELTTILAQLVSTEANLSAENQDLRALVEDLSLTLTNLEEETLSDLAQRLAQLSDDLAALDTTASERLMEVVGGIEAFKGTVEADLEELNVTLADLHLLGGIMTDLEELSAGLDKAQSEILGDVEEAKDEQLGRNDVNMGLLILVIVLLLVIIALVLTSRRSPPPEMPLLREEEPVILEELEQAP